MIVGIDLGTTNSLVCSWKDGQHTLLPNALGKIITPSVVGLDDKGRVIVGQAAKDRLLTHPENTVALFKRYMGSDADIKLGDTTFKPQELSALVIKQLIEDAQNALGEPITEAVITVPAYFNDIQRKMTQLAGRLAGVKVERILNEPTAAALAYGLSEEKDCQILVFDLGGGTFVGSILELYDGIMEVRASAGNNQLGGEDFTAKLASHFDDTLREMGVGSESPARLISEAERAKQALSNSDTYEASFHLDTDPVSISISRVDFEKLVEPLLLEIQNPVIQALNDSRLSPKDIDHILLVGGATQMPIVSKLVTKMFGRFPDKSLDPDCTVAIGSAVQAGLKQHDQALDEIVLTDVCPFSLGIAVVVTGPDGGLTDGVFSPIIERNIVVPASRMETYYSTVNDQEVINIRVYQGESRYVRNNNYLGLLELPIPKAPAGHESIEVRFSYDTNGLLEVEAKVVSTGKLLSSIFSAQSEHLSEEQIEKSLEKLAVLKIHPRDELPNTSFMAKADRLYAQNLGEKREEIGRIIDYFRSILESGNKSEVDDLRQKLEKDLASYEF